MKSRAAFSSAWRCCVLSAPWCGVSAGGADVAGAAVEVGALVGLGSEVEVMAAAWAVNVGSRAEGVAGAAQAASSQQVNSSKGREGRFTAG